MLFVIVQNLQISITIAKNDLLIQMAIKVAIIVVITVAILVATIHWDQITVSSKLKLLLRARFKTLKTLVKRALET